MLETHADKEILRVELTAAEKEAKRKKVVADVGRIEQRNRGRIKAQGDVVMVNGIGQVGAGVGGGT